MSDSDCDEKMTFDCGDLHVGKRIAKDNSTCGQDRCLGSHGNRRKQSRQEATLSVCGVTILVSDMARYYFEVQHEWLQGCRSIVSAALLAGQEVIRVALDVPFILRRR